MTESTFKQESHERAILSPYSLKWFSAILRHPIASYRYLSPLLTNYHKYKSQWHTKTKPGIEVPMVLPPDTIINKLNGTTLKLTKEHMWEMFNEYPFWEFQYLPQTTTPKEYPFPNTKTPIYFTNKYSSPKSIEGQTILDIGAGCGETAYFYFQHGAKKVICIEQDDIAFEYLQWNSSHNNWNTDVYHKPFDLSDLTIPCDLVKMDIEGLEIDLLFLMENQTLPPIILELHSDKITENLTREFPELKIKCEHLLYETKILSNCG